MHSSNNKVVVVGTSRSNRPINRPCGQPATGLRPRTNMHVHTDLRIVVVAPRLEERGACTENTEIMPIVTRISADQRTVTNEGEIGVVEMFTGLFGILSRERERERAVGIFKSSCEKIFAQNIKKMNKL